MYLIAVCDAAFFRDEDVAVIGGGDSAIQEGPYLAQSAKSVTVIHRRDQLRAKAELQQKAFKTRKWSLSGMLKLKKLLAMAIK